MARVFIDGEVGTTGLQIRQRLAGRSDIDLISLSDDRRKDISARLEACIAADVAILCLPDDAAREVVKAVQGHDVRLIDASTAHRIAEGWVFGFAELTPDQRRTIAAADRVSNPGCYSTGAIALLRPLVDAGLVAPDAAVSINAVSGYSGGGKAMIAEFEADTAPPLFVYGTDQHHKHLPEIMQHGGLSRRPVFSPSVGNFAQGMIVQIPMAVGPGDIARLRSALADRYADAQFVEVADGPAPKRLDPTELNGTNLMRLHVGGDDDLRTAVLYAQLDNLGKGASGAAVQALNLMLGQPEETGLTTR
ncbi:ArgC-1 [Oceaniovalibus guishaninsula JLT2003]|uniref:N-acetyl-gamma-glutamyl-phosphate reductase n=1 Tax=Oceaniovalibus guishaninsula JLT2003 TaxID=1231392 RepID=K2GRN3_9RHOB|nr:N-acetyl-gamma-glutamyl-phosphate reductase [Oceaniovalibus guishaninsula]EKE45271.1 ArgC-1 [Oceaniovalibus guishaninsula JLT2003]